MALSPELQAAGRAGAAPRVPGRRRRVGRRRSSATFFLPHIDLQPVPAMAGEQLIEAEMANLDAKSEPIVVE